jgi:uncharacterized protein YukE
MSESFAATLASLAKVADHLDESSSDVGSVVWKLVANLTAEGPAWGGDKSGKEFEKGYNEQSGYVHKNIDAKRELLDGYSGGIRTAADNFAQQDQS